MNCPAAQKKPAGTSTSGGARRSRNSISRIQKKFVTALEKWFQFIHAIGIHNHL
jgi:hypothetical protein